MTTTVSTPAPVRARAAALAWILPALGFGLPTPFVMAYLQRTGELPMTPFGFRAHDGPFASAGQDVFMVAAVVLMASCLIDGAAGVELWRGRRRGATLGFASTPLTVAMCLGFAFPLLLAAVPIRLALGVAAWPGLR